MTIVSTVSICLAVICAFLLGWCLVISLRRDKRNQQLKSTVKKLRNRLDQIADSSKYDRYFEIEEEEITGAYNVNLKVHVRERSCVGEHIEDICYCLIKSFPFDDDKEFAKREAEELLETLNA